MIDSESPVTTASHGDAQSDIVGGAFITAIVLFLFMILLVIALLFKIIQMDKQVQEEASKSEQLEQTLEQTLGRPLTSEDVQNLFKSQELEDEKQEIERERDEVKEKLEQAQKELDQAVKERLLTQRETADAKAELEKAQKKISELEAELTKLSFGNLVNSGLRIWEFKDGEVMITDSEIMEGGKFWQQRFACRKKKSKHPAVIHNPDLESEQILGK
ncbi:hypothetical protein HY771_02925 [Candidatus Uhrbacteria bacterium]|nr:hypothetical protein [Candidatus Uhrbacteria bacterium]